MRLYLDTTVLAALTYFKDKDVARYSECKKLIKNIKGKSVEFVISFYSIHELFLLPFDYEDEKTARKIGLTILKEVFDIENIEITELLSREKRIIYQDSFHMSDRTDIPHAISAHIENCDCIVTYDSHFDQISHKIKVLKPGDVPY